MKADRLMRVSGRKNLWLLRNTNKIYENAVKSYYERKNSFLAYNPVIQNLKVREEYRAPQRKTSEYPRNHKQMVEQVTNANSGNLLNTLMQANRRRSMSFSAGGLRMYGCSSRGRGNFGSSQASSSTLLGAGNKQRRNRRTPAAEMDIDQLNLSVLHERSMSLPARTTLELGMDKKVRSRDPQPSCRHHLNKIEQSAQRQRSRISDYDSDYAYQQLMVVDEALKQRIAVRCDHQAEAGVDFGSGRLIDGLQLKGLSQAAQKEQIRFHTFSDRIRRFEVIQFADGPVKFQAFNRRQEYGSGRIRHLCSKLIPKQPHCLCFHNVLHTNHRQRCLNYPTKQELKQKQEQVHKMVTATKRRATQAVQLASVKKKAPPLEPLGPLAPNWRPQQKQQQQEQQQPRDIDTLPRLHKNLNKSKSKRSIRLAKTRSKILKQTGSKTKTKNKQLTQQQQQHQHLDKEEIKKMGNLISSRYSVSGIQAAATANKITRTSHVAHIRGSNAGRRLELTPQRLAEQLQAQHKVKMPQKITIKLPQQLESLKDINHLLAASATQVSAYKRAFKNRQPIMQAEMLHMHAQQLPQSKHQKLQQPQHRQQQQHRQHVNRQQQHPQQLLSKPTGCLPKAVKTHATSQPKSEPKPPAKMKTKTKQPKQQQPREQHQKQLQLLQAKPAPLKKKATVQWEGKKPTDNQQSATIPLPVEPSQKRRRLNLPAHEPAGGHKNATEKYLSTSYQRMQQQQLHQQLRQRRQQPYENIWRHTY